MEESPSNGRGKNKRFWHAEEDKALVSSLLELSGDPHWKCENGFRNGYMVRLEEMMEKRIPGCGMRAMPHIDSRLKTLTTKYRAICAMLNTSGFKWDDTKCMISVGRDVYDEYCKHHSTAKNLYGVPFPHFHELDEIYGKEYANGKKGEDILEAFDNMGRDVNELSNECGDVVGDVSEFAPKKTRKRKEVESVGVELAPLKNFMQDMTSHMSTIANVWTKQQQREEELSNKNNNIMDELLKLDGLTYDQVFEAATILTAAPNKLDVFYQCPPSLKKLYITRLIHSDASSSK